MADATPLYLREDVVAVPRFAGWYAWSFLISPATAALYLANRYVRIMESYLEAPELHAQAVANAAMRGGPFMDWPAERRGDIQALLDETRQRHAGLLSFAADLGQCWELLKTQADGHSMAQLYPRLPDSVRGYAELVYSLTGAPDLRLIEALLYRSPLYDTSAQSTLVMRGGDVRPFALGTPQLECDGAVALQIAYASPANDMLAALRHAPRPFDAIAESLGLEGARADRFHALLTGTPPARRGGDLADTAPVGSARWRYFGHACVLVETPGGRSVLIDPLVPAGGSAGQTPRFTLADLPQRIDCVALTHNHQDHVQLETLLALRSRIGRVLVPAGGGGSLADPSLKLALQAAGFADVQEIGPLEVFSEGDLTVTALPFLGEHADLDIRTKAAWLVDAAGSRLLFAADSNNLEPRLYEHLRPVVGSLQALFIGMECEGAPLSWLYGPLLPTPLDRARDQSRRLDGSDYRRAMGLLRMLQCEQVFVYALGLEPWLSFITSIEFDPESAAMRSVRSLLAACEDLGIPAERLYGKAEG